MSTHATRVAVIGASGYGGAELARLLALHPHAEMTIATASGERAGIALSDLFPSLRGVCDIVCQEFDANRIVESCDFVFIALPHGKAMEIVPRLLEAVKVCDIGADFRLRDAAVFETWYKMPHSAPETLRRAVYGLPEWNKEAIQGAQLVANPGCYPTSAILALSPLVASDAIETGGIIVDSASGTSGAGRASFGLGLHHPEMNGDFKAYNVASHRHTPEIEQGLQDAATQANASGAHMSTHVAPITFTAHLLPIARGILSTCYATLKQELSATQIHEIVSDTYANTPFARVLPLGQIPQIKHVVGSNFCDLGVQVDARANRVIVVSAIDNLVKGAAGQAIQNMNLMCGFDETSGLKAAPLFP